jgi:hypothetical protein
VQSAIDGKADQYKGKIIRLRCEGKQVNMEVDSGQIVFETEMKNGDATDLSAILIDKVRPKTEAAAKEAKAHGTTIGDIKIRLTSVKKKKAGLGYVFTAEEVD